MKKTAKATLVAIMGWQVRRLRAKNKFKTVVVVGSIGKTSTKFAVAQIASRSMRVRFQEGNYNDLVSVPLVFFDEAMPNLLNPFAWLKIIIGNQRQLGKPYPYDVVVLELGTDGPGQIGAFKKYISADLAVVTAITPEHMEFFDDLDQVAKEELAVASYSKELLVNIDLASEQYLSTLKAYKSYAKNRSADYRLTKLSFNGDYCSFSITKEEDSWLKANHTSFSEPQLYSLTAGAAVADILGTTPSDIVDGFKNITSVPGRMQRLKGIKGSIIIDDTYNSSPEATVAALDTLYRIDAPRKIALLGNMNELGKFSAVEHAKIGKHCDPKNLYVVLTLGPDANNYLAAAAEKRGCKVIRFDSPYEAGEWLKQNIEQGTALLIKGSQNGVFAEEAVKKILADSADASKLVRQSSAWMKIKEKQFTKQ